MHACLDTWVLSCKRCYIYNHPLSVVPRSNHSGDCDFTCHTCVSICVHMVPCVLASCTWCGDHHIMSSTSPGCATHEGGPPPASACVICDPNNMLTCRSNQWQACAAGRRRGVVLLVQSAVSHQISIVALLTHALNAVCRVRVPQAWSLIADTEGYGTPHQ
jgi:hypothetical protein